MLICWFSGLSLGVACLCLFGGWLCFGCFVLFYVGYLSRCGFCVSAYGFVGWFLACSWLFGFGFGVLVGLFILVDGFIDLICDLVSLLC